MRRRKRKAPVMLLSLMIGLAAAVVWGGWALREQQELADKVVRLHILANSDSEEDQALKLTVRDAVLEEGNTWNDTFWGVHLKNGQGQNHLGRILMKIRTELRTAE